MTPYILWAFFFLPTSISLSDAYILSKRMLTCCISGNLFFQDQVREQIDQTKISSQLMSCIRPVRVKFELTNQDSAGGNNFNVLTSMQVNMDSVEIKQLFLIQMALNTNNNNNLYCTHTCPKKKLQN